MKRDRIVVVKYDDGSTHFYPQYRFLGVLWWCYFDNGYGGKYYVHTIKEAEHAIRGSKVVDTFTV